MWCAISNVVSLSLSFSSNLFQTQTEKNEKLCPFIETLNHLSYFDHPCAPKSLNSKPLITMCNET